MPRLPIALLLSLLPLAAAGQASSSLTPRVRIETTHGDFVVELDTVRAPLTAENFLRYVRDGAYDGTVFHRVILNFVVQGGGYDQGLALRTPRAPVPNESGNGLSNRRGTIGLARDDSPHSGSSQFYVNLVDNAGLDPLPTRWGFAVFGRVVEGMETIDRIAHLPTETVPGFGSDVPAARPAIRRAWVIGSDPGAPAPPAPAETEEQPADGDR
jgi:cyclophilin family peptidyl-prolyl cis-trans isomerase